MPAERTHPLLAQVPLTVSPFVTLPTAATLPYTYKAMPSALPPAATGVTGATGEKPKYVVSQSGHAAHPDDIIASCRALQAHITKQQEEAERTLYELDEKIRARELAEKRRVAPGWLDSEARLLEPERKPGATDDADVAGLVAEMSIAQLGSVSEMAVDRGEELDRAFGGLK
ncbi:hypothetical protein GGS21DRAFT_485669 [Xylaria nigripes]|nr:hypothetical protein GGS21DRAFT_485669 [Xylaria nigripes]